MGTRMLGMFAASLLVFAGCGDGLDTESESAGLETLEHRQGGCTDDDDDDDYDYDDDESAADDEQMALVKNGREQAEARAGRGKRSRCSDEQRGRGSRSRDGGVLKRPRRDGGTGPVVVPGDRPASPPTSNRPDAGTPREPTAPRDPGNAGGTNTVRLPDGSVIVLDQSCPSLPTPFNITLPGCCLPSGSCGLSTHEVDALGIPKGCQSYEAARAVDPTFSLPVKLCAARP